jgi:hypothetical protein
MACPTSKFATANKKASVLHIIACARIDKAIVQQRFPNV